MGGVSMLQPAYSVAGVWESDSGRCIIAADSHGNHALYEDLDGSSLSARRSPLRLGQFERAGPYGLDGRSGDDATLHARLQHGIVEMRVGRHADFDVPKSGEGVPKLSLHWNT